MLNYHKKLIGTYFNSSATSSSEEKVGIATER
jgi:hypothetical protein